MRPTGKDERDKKDSSARSVGSFIRVMSAGVAEQLAHRFRFWIPFFSFSCYFVFLLLYINPTVIYSSNGVNIHRYVAAMHAQNDSPDHVISYADPPYRSPFILELTPEYLLETVIMPGGWTRLAVTLCIYTCNNPFTGAIAITVLALFFYWLFTWYTQGFGSRRPVLTGLVPSFFLMTLCVWYEFYLPTRTDTYR